MFDGIQGQTKVVEQAVTDAAGVGSAG